MPSLGKILESRIFLMFLWSITQPAANAPINRTWGWITLDSYDSRRTVLLIRERENAIGRLLYWSAGDVTDITVKR